MATVVSKIEWAVSPDRCNPYRHLANKRGPEPPPPVIIPPEPPEPTVDPRFFDVILLVGSESGSNFDESPAQNGTGGEVGKVNTSIAKFGTKSMDPRLTYIDFGNKNDVFNISPTQMTEFTIEAWVYMDNRSDPNTPQVICGKSFFGIQWAFLVQPSGDPRFAYQTYESGFGGNGSFTNILCSPNTIRVPLQQWCYVALTKDAAKHFRLYVGDNAAGVVRMVGKRTPNDASIDGQLYIDSLSIGQIGLFGTNNWLGAIDEIRITRHVARYRTDTTYPLPRRAWPRPPPVTKSALAWEKQDAESV